MKYQRCIVLAGLSVLALGVFSGCRPLGVNTTTPTRQNQSNTIPGLHRWDNTTQYKITALPNGFEINTYVKLKKATRDPELDAAMRQTIVAISESLANDQQRILNPIDPTTIEIRPARHPLNHLMYWHAKVSATFAGE